MDHETLNWVINSAVKRLYGCYQCHHLDREELIAEAYLKVCERIGDYDPTKGMKESSFIYTVVYGHLRRLVRDDKSYLLFPLKDEGGAYEDDVLRDTKITLDQIESHLSERDQKIFSMLREGHTYRSIGEAVGISRTIIGRLVNAIRKEYQEV